MQQTATILLTCRGDHTVALPCLLSKAAGEGPCSRQTAPTTLHPWRPSRKGWLRRRSRGGRPGACVRKLSVLQGHLRLEAVEHISFAEGKCQV